MFLRYQTTPHTECTVNTDHIIAIEELLSQHPGSGSYTLTAELTLINGQTFKAHLGTNHVSYTDAHNQWKQFIKPLDTSADPF